MNIGNLPVLSHIKDRQIENLCVLSVALYFFAVKFYRKNFISLRKVAQGIFHLRLRKSF